MIEDDIFREALLIRRVEETFLELFSKGKLNGTVHTCVGQEFSAIAFAGQLSKDDFIFSNHRCHGHFISFTKDIYGLIGELLGKEDGICGGIGSSQHLHKNNFYSNGIQGGIVPVAAGLALAGKLRNRGQIGLVFIGDGTLGQGVLYETMNIISKWSIPLLIVCENNSYAQSTHQETNLAGNILHRAEAFDIQTFKSDTWDIETLFHNAATSIEYVRSNTRPAFHLVDTYRLNPHSKSDDFRNKDEIDSYSKIDPLNVYKDKYPDKHRAYLEEINLKISEIQETLHEKQEMPIREYYDDKETDDQVRWMPVEEVDERQVNLINEFFDDVMSSDKNLIFMGEDVLSPYGGAFKVAKNLSVKYPDQVFSTPISEAAITGIANGLALAGVPVFLEIMFGDFITLSFDQLLNHAAKFYHMYNKQVTCPVVIRTPMGGRRGYGPTHSQTLDKFIAGIDNISTIALNTLINPKEIYRTIYEEEKHPVIVIENKMDYGKKIAKKRARNYLLEKSNHRYPLVRVSPVRSEPDITMVTYGGMADMVMDTIPDIFYELDRKPEIIVLTRIKPIDYDTVIDSVRKTKALFVVEEGTAVYGIGSEIIATVCEAIHETLTVKRIAALPVPIPSAKGLEDHVLPNKAKIIQSIKDALQ